MPKLSHCCSRHFFGRVGGILRDKLIAAVKELQLLFTQELHAPFFSSHKLSCDVEKHCPYQYASVVQVLPVTKKITYQLKI